MNKNVCAGKSWSNIKSKYLSRIEREEIELQAEIISQIIIARNERGLTQRQLEEISGISQPVLARLESGLGNPTLSTLVKVLDALDKKLVIIDV